MLATTGMMYEKENARHSLQTQLSVPRRLASVMEQPGSQNRMIDQ